MTFSAPTPGGLLLAPFSQEAEEAVIGSVLISPTVLPLLQGFMLSEYFYLTRHRLMWQIFVGLAARREIIDLTTVSEELRQQGALEEIGGYAYLIHLINNTPNSMHAEAYGRLVERTASRRKLLMAADQIREAAMDESINISEVAAKSESALASALNGSLTLEPLVVMQDAVDRFKNGLRDSIYRYNENPEYITGIRTGLHDLDVLTDGLPVGITVFAGPTGVGKTSVTSTIALNASRNGILHGKASMAASTVFFSGEMVEQQIMNRLIANLSDIHVRNIQRGNLTIAEMNLIDQACKDLEQHHDLTFESGKRLNTTQIKQRVRQLVANRELDLFIIDGLLQIDDLRVDDDMSKRKRQYMEAKQRDALRNIMNDLEDIALTYNIRFLLTHQLNREASKSGGLPQLYQLSEAISVEQKSALALLFYRESYYKPAAECKRNPNLGTIIAAKSRFGAVGSVDVWCDLSKMRITDVDTEQFSLTNDQ